MDKLPIIKFKYGSSVLIGVGIALLWAPYSIVLCQSVHELNERCETIGTILCAASHFFHFYTLPFAP